MDKEKEALTRAICWLENEMDEDNDPDIQEDLEFMTSGLKSLLRKTNHGTQQEKDQED